MRLPNENLCKTGDSRVDDAVDDRMCPTTIDYVKERQSDKTMTVEECELRGGRLETRDDGVQVCKVVESEFTNQDSSWLFSRDILMGVFVIAAVALASGSGGGGGFTDDDL